MASVTISHTWPDDEGETLVTVEVEGSYPDAVAEAKANAVAAMRETLALFGEE